MRPVLFVRVTDMKWYKGDDFNDQPVNGGTYIAEHGTGGEVENFKPVLCGNYEYCEAYFQLPNHGERLSIERITGSGATRRSVSVDDVTVVFVATPEKGGTRIVGWYNNATVYRHLQPNHRFGYYVKALKADCVLLPIPDRNKQQWKAPNKRRDGFGFGQSNVWYPNQPGASNEEIEYLERILYQIDTYTGANWC